MALDLKTTVEVLKGTNIEAAQVSAKQQLGGVALDQLVKVVKPRLPIMVRGYADEPWFQAILANVAAGVITTYMSDNPKALQVADALVYAGMNDTIVGFDVRGMINEFIEDLPIMGETTKGGE